MTSFVPGYYDENELREMGFKSVGENVSIAKNCTIIGQENISIGNSVRIDSYCTIIVTGDGYLELGSYIHIGGYCHLSAGKGIVMGDFSGLSQGVKIYSRTDDYSGEFLTNPMVPEKYTGVVEGPVALGRHVIIGSGTVLLPNITVGEGSSVGAQSLITKNLAEWGVFVGLPARRIKSRSKKLLELESAFLADK